MSPQPVVRLPQHRPKLDFGSFVVRVGGKPSPSPRVGGAPGKSSKTQPAVRMSRGSRGQEKKAASCPTPPDKRTVGTPRLLALPNHNRPGYRPEHQAKSHEEKGQTGGSVIGPTAGPV